jgi:hypothetical protein
VSTRYNEVPVFPILCWAGVTSRRELSEMKIYSSYVIFEIFTAVTMKNGVFCDVTQCGSCKNRRFGGT